MTRNGPLVPTKAFHRSGAVARTVITILPNASNVALAQTKLKWAHVYETSEPYHKWSLWAADEIKKRTAGRYDIAVFPSSCLRSGAPAS